MSPALRLRVAYLASYEGMGRAALSCVGSCECSTRIDAHAPRRDQNISVTAQHRVPSEPRAQRI
jgi:hypothetical protein